MRQRALAAWVLLGLGLALAVAGRSLPAERVWSTIAGLFLLTAIGLGVSLLPIWKGLVAPVQPLPDLFQRPSASERWCSRCGNPTARKGPCRACGHAPTPRTPRTRGSGASGR